MSTSLISTHVLDTARGRPAPGVAVRLDGCGMSGSSPGASVDWSPLATGVTDDNGRLDDCGPALLPAGRYRLTFDTAAYFVGHCTETFFPEVVVVFTISEGERHCHVPLLLSPFGFSTYRGN